MVSQCFWKIHFYRWKTQVGYSLQEYKKQANIKPTEVKGRKAEKEGSQQRQLSTAGSNPEADPGWQKEEIPTLNHCGFIILVLFWKGEARY